MKKPIYALCMNRGSQCAQNAEKLPYTTPSFLHTFPPPVGMCDDSDYGEIYPCLGVPPLPKNWITFLPNQGVWMKIAL